MYFPELKDNRYVWSVAFINKVSGDFIISKDVINATFPTCISMNKVECQLGVFEVRYNYDMDKIWTGIS